MTADQLIAKQQLEIETLKERMREARSLVDNIYLGFYAIGAPLNDNRLGFTGEQRKSLYPLADAAKTALASLELPND